MGIVKFLILLFSKIMISAADPLPWTIEASIKANFTKELAALDSLISEIQFINVDYRFFYFEREKNGLEFIFNQTSAQLRKVFDALVEAEFEKSDVVNKTFRRIGEVKKSFQDLSVFGQSIEKEYRKEQGLPKEGIWKALNVSIEGIWDTLRSELFKIEKPFVSTYYAPPKKASSKLNATLNGYLRSISNTTSDMREFVQTMLDKIKQFMQLYNRNEVTLNSTIDFDKIAKEMDYRVEQCKQEFNTTIGNLNYTIFYSYSPMLKNKLIGNGSAINHLLLKQNSTAEFLFSIQDTFKSLKEGISQRLLSDIPALVHYFYVEGLDRYSRMIFENSTKFELCYQKQDPTIAQVTTNYSKFVERCLLRQLDYLPNVVLMIKEFLKPFRDVVFAPVQNLKSCIYSIGNKFCYPDFVETYMANVTSQQFPEGRMQMVELLNNIAVNIYFTVSNELGTVVDQFRRCSSEGFVIDHMNKLANDQLQCLEQKRNN